MVGAVKHAQIHTYIYIFLRVYVQCLLSFTHTHTRMQQDNIGTFVFVCGRSYFLPSQTHTPRCSLTHTHTRVCGHGTHIFACALLIHNDLTPTQARSPKRILPLPAQARRQRILLHPLQATNPPSRRRATVSPFWAFRPIFYSQLSFCAGCELFMPSPLPLSLASIRAP